MIYEIMVVYLLSLSVRFLITGSSFRNPGALTQPSQPGYHYPALGTGGTSALVDWSEEGSTVGGSLYTNASAKAAQHGVDLKVMSDGPFDER